MCISDDGVFFGFQIALQFPYRFWDSKVQGADYFGRIPPSPEKRGMFSVFYDMRPKVRLFKHKYLSYLTPYSLLVVFHHENFCQYLRNVFVPEPATIYTFCLRTSYFNSAYTIALVIAQKYLQSFYFLSPQLNSRSVHRHVNQE